LQKNTQIPRKKKFFGTAPYRSIKVSGRRLHINARKAKKRVGKDARKRPCNSPTAAIGLGTL